MKADDLKNNINIINDDIILLQFNFTYYVVLFTYSKKLLNKPLLVLATITLILNFYESQHSVVD